MLESHGPALLVHNNKTFLKDDFENITKLAGATKQNKPLKIGKFGIGFCSVYHITDVPSFVSQDTLTIFDPTMNHLKKEIKNPSRPGKKVRYTSSFIRRSKQLMPYDGLFGFNPQQEYNGTLFRLPFRSAASELSGTCYTEDHHIKHLTSEMAACSSNLILFLQHIKKITFQVIRSGESKPTITLEISKAALSMPNIPLSTSTSLEEIKCKTRGFPAVTSNWIVSNHSDRINKKQAKASVAISLLREPSEFYTVDIANEGEVFCFLPLSQKVGLPVHVSGNFAVISNRRGIWTSDDATFSSEEVCWNISLMESVIPTAYYQLLLALQSMYSQLVVKKYVFYSCWPLKDNLKSKNPWMIMISKLYQMIYTSRLFYSDNIAKWLSINESKFLAPGILCQSITSSNITEDECITDVVKHLKLPIVRLPMSHRLYFHLSPYIISEKDFLSLFFENLMSLRVIKQSRDQLILRMLEVYTTEYDDGTERSYIFQEYFEQYACIPCAPDGTVLRKCTELINPIASFAKLYDEAEKRFPLKELTNRHLACTSLIDLGMMHKKLPYKDVVERAQTVKGLYNKYRSKALNRIKLLLKTIEFNMKETKGKAEIPLDTIQFLPVLSKPNDFLLAWAGDGRQLMCGKELMVNSVSKKYTNENNSIISGSQVIFLNESPEDGCDGISLKCQNLLNIRNSPTCGEVVCHLKELIQTFESQIVTTETKSWVDRACQQTYRFLEDKKSDEEIKCIRQLLKLACIWNGKKFLYIHQIAKLWKLDGPYLHQVPTMLSLRHHLCQVLGIKEDFSIVDVENALNQMKQDFGDQPVNENSQQLLKELVSYFLRIKPDEFSDFKILLPDEKYILMWSTDLAYNDAPWAPRDRSYRYVNDIIPRVLAKQLHVKPVRAKLLERYDNPSLYFPGVEFGQREELTRRIQNILRDYPFDVTVLKELLQNADDAKATKMYVILDKRTHKTQSIISEKWGKLQGPALLVWNDSVFSEKDIKGIQELGLGSKRCEAESIGQYGIGFNSAYHLTDCPSFVTDGDILCVMDPHCTFVPGATPLKPGRRFDNLKSGFWDDFQDMKSAYLRSNVDNLPPELLGGSLFRFPLRSTYELVKTSKIAADLSGDTLVTSVKMEDLLKKWAPKMKAAMLFLNNVRELRFYVIQGDARIAKIQYHYVIDVSSSTQEVCDQFRKKVSAFKEERGCEPCLIRYPLTLVDINTKYREKWIIQQGVGDIERHNQTWTFIKVVKPRHGIAAPLSTTTSLDVRSCGTSSKLDGQVFCFLPLPISSHLPVHINGHFILNSTRRQLWQTTNPGEDDSKSIWNKNLLSAIASSYLNFLKNAHQYYVSEEYCNLSILHRDLKFFYSVFPEADAEHLDELWLTFAKDCYSKACNSNSTLLAVVKKEQIIVGEGKQSKFIVTWHPLKSVTPSCQVYFWYESCYEQKKIVWPVLEAIGMKLTSAPFKLSKYFNNEIKEDSNKCPAISPSTVYMYYSHFYNQTASSQFPCGISATSFKSVENFKIFTRYILQRSTVTVSNQEVLEFPSPPFGFPLLLTADGKLRKFDEHNKVIFSQFAELFPRSNDCFIHSSLLDINYTKAYFVSGSQSDYSLIHRILADNLPQYLCDTKMCNDAKSLIPLKVLQLLWHCFSLDPVFGNNLASILNRWALILTTDNRFFSNACQLHPILPFTDGHEQSLRAFQVLVRIGMPVVNTSVVTAVVGTNCPVMSQPTEVLNSLFHLAQDIDLSANLASSDVKILIEYLNSINYRTQPGSQHQVKCLPLFENIVGNFVSLSGLQVFIWPIDCSCTSGYKVWIRGYSVVFLKQNASWSQLCSPDELQIQYIETEDMYVKYVFPHFHLMSESERYEHLCYIRDNLYYINNVRLVRMHHISAVARQRASSFIDALKLLQCIGKDGHPLFQVSDFCDHEQRIFTTFSRHFKFLPDYFTSNQQEIPRWMDFFRGLGLKTTIAHEEFIQFCTETAGGQVADIREASSVLIESLFNSKQEWHGHPGFLTRVSQIGFLCSEKLPTLTWITSCAQTSRRIQPNVSEYVDMTKPSNAAIMSYSTILWTVKPIVTLPDKQGLLHQLSVCTEPSSSDVVQNLCNICMNSQFTDISLFDKRRDHLRPPEEGKPLSSVFLEHFHFLQTNVVTSNDLCTLQNHPCIPVYASPDSSLASDIVLVKPQVVLTNTSAADYYPFLHQLPDVFSYLTNLLQKIGVKKELNVKHMQMVLESAYKCSGGKEIDPNTNQCVVKALKFIYKTLKEVKEDENQGNTLNEEKLLSPFYLPSKSGTLVLSTNLLYHDEPYFYGRNLDLGATEYTELDIPYSKYEFYQSEFCNMLPPSLRPKGISKLCSVQVATECEPCDPSDIARKLSSTLKLSILPKAVVTAVKHKAFKDRKVVNDVKLQPQLDGFLKSIKVVTYKNLKLVIVLKETMATIGKVKVSFYLEKKEPEYTLYLDTALNGTLVLHMFSELADLLASSVQQFCNAVVPFSIKKTFEYFLMAESATDLIQELQRRCLPIADLAATENVRLCVGMDIPQDWHYRLDQDINNLFHANEYVGYEDEEGHIIVVRIVHLIASGSEHNLLCQYNKRYLVFTSEGDEIGMEVSVLSLYKFTKGAQKSKTHHSRSVVPYTGDVNASSIADDTNLKSVKKKVCEELEEIWQLDLESRKKALRRQYLKWHPDRNPDNPDFAEKVFKFLLAQIDKLEQGLPLDDPEYESTATKGFNRASGRSGWWNDHFRQWDQTAHQHQRSQARDYERYQRRSTNVGGGSSASPFSAGDDNFRVPRQPQEGRRWMLQANVDHEVMLMLYEQMENSGNDRIAGHVCFHAHQVAEKSLKAGMYAICGLDEKGLKDHALTRHAYALQTERPLETQHLAYHTSSLENFYLDTRYPNRHASPSIPATVYSPATAQDAIKHATTIYSTINSLIDS